MKSLIRSMMIVSLGLCVFLGAGYVGSAQTAQVGVDSSRTWLGYMNVYDLGNNYLWGNAWGTADLPAVFSGSTLTLSPNVNVYNAVDPYWVNPDGSGAKLMDANFYVEDASLSGNNVVFSGNVLANTLAAGYTAQAFIKEFTAGYGWVNGTWADLIGGQPFSLSQATTAGDIIQYGFEVKGPDANPATVALLGYASLEAIPEPTSLALLGLGLVSGLGLLRRRQ